MKLKLFIILTLLCALLCACGSDPVNPEENLSQNIGQPTTTEQADPTESATEATTTEATTASTEETTPSQVETVAPPTEDPNKIVYDALPTGLTATKVNTVADVRFQEGGSAGVIYNTKGGKYGILSLDGSADTGSNYTACEQEGNYFVVTSVDPDTVSYDTPATVNCMGLVDGTGKELIPQKYAHIEEVNDRYMYVVEVTEVTDSEDEALIYFTSSWVSLSPGDDDILYKGVWYVYDVLTGRFVDGVTGTHYTNVLDYGDYMVYYDAEDNRIMVGPDGKALPSDANTFNNGCYELDNVVYTSDHVKVFEVDPDGYSPYMFENGYYVASKYDSNGSKYVLMDEMGNIVSAEFSDTPSVYGSLLFVDDRVCTFDGTSVIEGTYDRVVFDEQLGNAWFLEDNDNYTLITKDGTVIWQGEESDTLYVDPYSFLMRNKIDGEDRYYTFAQKDYVVEGYTLAPWLVEASAEDYKYSVVDTLSGETILTGYKDYDVVTVPGYAFYIYAELSNGGFDIYSIG